MHLYQYTRDGFNFRVHSFHFHSADRRAGRHGNQWRHMEEGEEAGDNDRHTHILLYFPQPVHCIVTWMVCSGDWMVREEVHRIPAVCCGVSDEIRGKRKDPSFLSSHAAHPPTMITSSPTCHVEVRALKWPSWGDPGQVTWLLSSLRTPRTLTSAGAWWWHSGGVTQWWWCVWAVKCEVSCLSAAGGGLRWWRWWIDCWRRGRISPHPCRTLVAPTLLLITRLVSCVCMCVSLV